MLHKILAISLNILHNYFDIIIKIIFRSVSRVKFLDTSAKPYFPCIFSWNEFFFAWDSEI